LFHGLQSELDGDNVTCFPIQVSTLSDEVHLQTNPTKGKAHKLDSHLCEVKEQKETNTSLSSRISAVEYQMREVEYHHIIQQQKTREEYYQSVDNIHKQYKSRLESLNQNVRFLLEEYLRLEDMISKQTRRLKQLESEVSQHKKNRNQAFIVTTEVRFVPE
jgi:predicted RNase H-like nuclease (RuvC/YqgF family)